MRVRDGDGTHQAEQPAAKKPERNDRRGGGQCGGRVEPNGIIGALLLIFEEARSQGSQHGSQTGSRVLGSAGHTGKSGSPHHTTVSVFPTIELSPPLAGHIPTRSIG